MKRKKVHPPFYHVKFGAKDRLRLYLPKRFYLGSDVCLEFRDEEIIMRPGECEGGVKVSRDRKTTTGYTFLIPANFAHLYRKYDFVYMEKKEDEIHIYFFTEEELLEYLKSRKCIPRLDETIFMHNKRGKNMQHISIYISAEVMKKISDLSKKYKLGKSKVVYLILKNVLFSES